MSQTSKIEWTQSTWNPVVGCSKLSPGCKGCYAINQVHRMAGNPNPKISAANAGLTVIQGGHPNWTGKVRLIPERLDIPLRRRKPTTYFVNSLSDLFHEELEFSDINKVWLTMGACQRHTFQVLTKRAERMSEFVTWSYSGPDHQEHAERARGNIWLGVSAEDQSRADERIPHILRTPAAVRFLSVEPLLGPLDIYQYLGGGRNPIGPAYGGKGIDWVIVGGESGPGARPMKVEWVRGILHQCAAAGVPFFFKQWGEWAPGRHEVVEGCVNRTNGRYHFEFDPTQRGRMAKLGKKAAGRLLDGRTWDAMPEVAHV